MSVIQQEHLGLADGELREELDRLAGAARDEFERGGGAPSKRLARTLLDWRHYLAALERIEDGDAADDEAELGDDAYLLTTSARSPAHWARLARRRVGGKARRQMIARLAGRLLADGVDPEIVVALMQAQNAARACPPLPSAAVVETVRWVMAREIERLEAA